MENNRRGSEIFLGVIGVATLVVAIIGATFAFFSASTNSAENAVIAGSTQLGLNFDDSANKNLKTNLIPAAENIATYAALEQTVPAGAGENEQCVDDNGNSVCGVYQFTVSNLVNATATQDITFTLNVVTNGFTNLKYKIYTGAVTDLTSSSTAKVTATTFPAANGTATLALGNLSSTDDPTGTKFRLGTTSPDNSVTYTMVIWLDETNKDQSAGQTPGEGESDEAGKSFAAGLTITSSDGTHGVTGVIAAAG